MKGVYQNKEYREALKKSNAKLIVVNDNFQAIEKNKRLAISKKIIEARGTPSEEELKEYRKIAKTYWYGIIAPCIIDPQNELFSKEGYKKVSNYSILINLKESEEELWKKCDKGSIRWGVNYAKKQNLKLETTTEIDAFYDIYLQTAKLGGFNPESKAFIESIIKTDIAELFLVKKDKEVLGGGMILIDKEYNYSILDLTAVSEEGMKLQMMPFLYWNLILHSKSLGLDYFDLGGYDKEAKEGSKMYNINKFKERFNGDIVEQPIYSTSSTYPFLRRLLKNMLFLKRLYKNE